MRIFYKLSRISSNTMGAKMITKIILGTILICNRTNKKLPGRKSCSGLVTGNFENSKLFEGLVILKKKKDKSNRKKKRASHHRIFFSPLPGVLMLMLMTASL